MKLSEFDIKAILYGLSYVRGIIKDDPEYFGIEFDWDDEQKFDDDVIKVTNRVSKLYEFFEKFLPK